MTVNEAIASSWSLQHVIDAAEALFRVVPVFFPDGEICDLHVTALNPAAEELIGPLSLDAETVATSQRVPPATAAELRALVTGTLVTGLPAAGEWHLVDDRGDRWWDFRVRPMDEGALVAAFDVTARHQAEAEAQHRYELIAEHATDVVLLVGEDGCYTWASPSITDLCGWSPDELVGPSFREFVHPDDLPAVIANRASTTLNVSGVDALRFRCKPGVYLWMSSTTRLFVDSNGATMHRVVALRDIHRQVEAQEQLAQSEARYRVLAENSSDAVYQADLGGYVSWVSPSIHELLGWHPEQFVGMRALDLVHLDDRARVAQVREEVRNGVERTTEARVRGRDGDYQWISIQGRPIIGKRGHVGGTVVALRACQAEVVARRARATLSASTGILLRADTEESLLAGMCQAAVDVGGYVLAWYGRAVHDSAKSVEVVAASREHAGYLREIQISWDAHSVLGHGPGSLALREGRIAVLHDMLADDSFGPWRPAAAARGFRSAVSLPVYVDGVIDGAFMVNAAEPRAFDEAAVAVLTDLAGQLGYGLHRLRDQQRLLAAAKEQALLTAAIEQAAESVLITDVSSSIVYANQAALSSSGYSLEELLGKSPGAIKSGVHDVAFYEAIWAQLATGAAWRGVIVNRRKSGELYEEDVTIAPITDADGAVVAFVGTKRDLTDQRRMEANLLEHEDDRALMLRVMSQVRSEETLAATSVALCEAIADDPDIDLAAVLILGHGNAFHVVGFAGDRLPQGLHAMPLQLGEPRSILAQIEERGRSLDLGEPAALSIIGPAHLAVLKQLGFIALGIGAVRSNGEVIGMLVTGTCSSAGPQVMRARRPVLEELGSFAGTLLAPQMDEDNRAESIRAELREIIDGRHFHPVYQPVVDLATRQICGYEALTRFADGTPPDVRFAMAHAVGMGIEMESACARAALEGASDLPSDVWLSLNFSPDSVVLGGGADLLARHASLRLVLEITEHAEIDDYGELRRALRSMAPAKVSVDDAGAGFASLRHILELKPDFVKLDIALVRGVDNDPARQALTVGLCHFAARTGAVLIAEGVETNAEAETLRGLGVPFAQGYLFGRPAPLR